MTNINTIEDLARILQEQPTWAEAFQSLLISRRLEELPERFDRFVQGQEEFNRRLDETILELREFNREQKEINQRQEERNRQLDETILELREFNREQKETNQRLEETLLELKESNREQKEINQRQEERNREHRENILELREMNRRLEESNREHSTTLLELKEMNQRQEETNREYRESIQELKESNREHSVSLQELKKSSREHSTDLQELKEFHQEALRRFNRIEGRLGNLEGGQYERSVRTKALARSQIVLGFARPYLALNQDGLTDPRLTSAISRAVQDGAITTDCFSDLFESDIIISAENNQHAVVEVSLTADRDDITRAKSRAAILSRVTGGSVTPIIITSRLNPAQSAQADADDVTVFVMPYP